jgi:2-hydroxymuconate-semialdehyde hydrolase
MSSAIQSAEIGQSILSGGIAVNYHDHGSGFPVVMIHGSGPGVSAFVNWRLVMPELARQRRVLAPDMVGFGFTERPAGMVYTLDNWVDQVIAFLDTMNLPQVDLVGNSFGGALSLALTVRHPERVRRLVLMGAAGVSFPITQELDDVWGYEPSFENMRRIMDVFAYDRNLVNDELARLRYEASIRPGFQESYASMFPAPRQRWVDALATADDAIAGITHETLIIHGREDKVIPLENSLRLSRLIARSQLHVFGRCGHWTQIEHAKRFSQLVSNFLAEADA